MRRSTNLLATFGLCLLTAGCGQVASDPQLASEPNAAPSTEWAARSTWAADKAASEVAEEAVHDYAMSPPAGESSVPSGPASGFGSREEPRVEPSTGDRGEDRFREGRSKRQQYRRSGQLTAGCIDDVERTDEFCHFLDQALRSRMFAGPVMDVRPQIVFQVTTDDGLPVGGAELTIKSSDRRAAVRLTSGSDGRAMLTVSDLGLQARHCEVTVRRPDGGQPIREQLSLDEDVCHIVVPDLEVERPRQLDLALIIDTTGSMGDELEYLKTEIDAIVARLRETFPNVDQRFALIVYRDHGDQYVSRKFDFTRSLDDLRGELSRQNASGGGDHPEAVHIALQQAAGLDWRPGNVARVAFLVGDAPPHDSDLLAAFEATSGLRASGVRLYPVASSGVEMKAEFVMRSAAFVTMGQYLFLTDHSGIGNPHAKPHTSEYLVEHLDRLMVRMITSELCGRRLQPDEVLAIERGDMALPYGSGPILLEQRQVWHRPSRPRQAASSALPEGTGMWLTLGAVLLGVFAYDSIHSREGA